MFRILVTLTIVALLFPQGGISFGDFQAYANFANDAIGIMKGDLPVEAILLGSTGPTLDRILEAIGSVSFGVKSIDGKPQRVKIDELVSDAVKELKFDGRLKSVMKSIHDYVVRVDSLNEKFNYYSESRGRFNNYTIREFSNTVTGSKDNDLFDVLEKMFALAVPGRSGPYTDSALDLLAKDIRAKEPSKSCSTGMSSQTRLYQLYTTMMMCETRGFVMALFGYAILSVQEKVPFFAEMELAKNKMVNRTSRYLAETQKLMKGLPRNIELCDSRRYKEGVNYFKLTSLWNYNSPTGHSFPTEPVLAAVDKNRAIAGLKWAMQDGFIQIGIKEGFLKPHGYLDTQNEEWKPFPHIASERDGFQNALFKYDDQNRRSRMSLGRDYQTLNAVSNMKLDDIMLPTGYVVTGIRMKYYSNDMSIEIQGTKFDFESGQLLPNEEDGTIWQTAESMEGLEDRPEEYKNKRKYLSPQWTNPSEEAEENEKVTDTNTKYGFTWVNTEDYEDMHRPVPYFDSRALGSQPSIALGGIGVFHRGHDFFGGYFNFRLYNVDISQFINPDYVDANDDYAK